jgi:hypothetical protein
MCSVVVATLSSAFRTPLGVIEYLQYLGVVVGCLAFQPTRGGALELNKGLGVVLVPANCSWGILHHIVVVYAECLNCC